MKFGHAYLEAVAEVLVGLESAGRALREQRHTHWRSLAD